MAAAVGHYGLDDLATKIVQCFPELDSVGQTLSLELYRFLANGQPVMREALTQRLEVPAEVIDRTLSGWPGVFRDAQRRIVGFWGLSIEAAYTSPHRLTIDGRALSAWCAWDTLFLPQILGKTAEVESGSPAGGEPIRLRVSPKRVERIEPPGATMSFLLPKTEDVKKDVVTSFCYFIHFFPSRQAGNVWAKQHAGAFSLSIYEAHVLATLKNKLQYGETLQ